MVSPAHLNLVPVGDSITALPILIQKTSWLWLPRLPHRLHLPLSSLFWLLCQPVGDLGFLSPDWLGLHSIQNFPTPTRCDHMCVFIYSI